MPKQLVLVVGTTSDYIAHLLRRCPSRALFITEPAERARATEQEPPPDQELLTGLSDTGRVAANLKAHLVRWGITPSGITCFDCESLDLAARLATTLSLPFTIPEAVALSRNKLKSKLAWRREGVPCPQAVQVGSVTEAMSFQAGLGKPVIMKPLTGSGSELVFLCRDQDQCQESYAIISARLAAHSNRRLFEQTEDGLAATDIWRQIIAEEFIPGVEYSCDFALQGEHLTLIRLARKYVAQNLPAGTIKGYLLPASIAADIDIKRLQKQLLRAAGALKLDRALCMVDFILADGVPYLLEMTPRPGGDCLPRLIRHSCGLDMLETALSFAEGRFPAIPPESDWEQLAGLRLFARQGGMIKNIDPSEISKDSRVRECRLKRRTGDRITLPPADYESHFLGHVIFKPQNPHGLEQEFSQLEAKLSLELEAGL